LIESFSIILKFILTFKKKVAIMMGEDYSQFTKKWSLSCWDDLDWTFHSL